MKKQVLILIAVIAGVSFAIAIASYHREIREWYRFRAVFIRLGKNADGLIEYRHRTSGVIATKEGDGLRVRLEGSVERGSDFRAAISPHLSFGLIEERGSSSWAIWVGVPDGDRGQNFSMPVTPPFRGVNHRYIEARHFRNSDNSGPNAGGPKNVNAPGEVREFSFVLNVQDCVRAHDLLNAMLWHSRALSENEAREQWGRLPRGGGKLTILDMEMDQLGVGLQPRILVMHFRLELWFSASHIEDVFFSP